ncbi:MAG: efflux RND transporter periplasmic adaptor subunit [Chthoniobacteraceae bacterium]
MRFSLFPWSGALAATLLLLSSAFLSAEPVQGLVLPFKEVSISSPPERQDVIQSIKVEEGDVVKKGEILAQLDDRAAKLDVEDAKQKIKQAEFTAKGMQQLLQEKMVSKDATLAKETDLELANTLYKAAQLYLDEKSIRSPLDGIVVKRYKEEGEAADKIEKMFDVVNIDKVYVQFYLDPRWMQRLHAGQEIKLHLPLLSEHPQFIGTVAFMDPRIDAASGLFRIKLLVDNPDHLIKAGMRAEVDFDQAVASN